MKIVCPSCERTSELTRYRLQGATLAITCTKCGQEWMAPPSTTHSGPQPTVAAVRAASLSSSPLASNVVELRTVPMEAIDRARSAAEGDPFTAPAGHCPKCIAPRDARAQSCPQCGLSFTQTDEASASDTPDWLKQAWRELLREWGAEPKHDALRAQAGVQGALMALGRLYRIRLAQMPTDPFGIRGRDELVRLASAPMGLTAVTREASVARWKLGLAVVVLVLSAVAVALLIRVLLRSQG